MKKPIFSIFLITALIGLGIYFWPEKKLGQIINSVSVSGTTLSTTTINQTPNIPGSSLQNGLVGWWTFDGTSVTSTGVVDKSGNNNTGTLVGGVTKVAGKIGQGMKFDGSTGYTSISSVMGLSTANVTISHWVKLPSLSTMGGFVKVGGNYGYGIGVGTNTWDINGNNLIMLFEGIRWIPTSYNFTDTKWHYITMTIDSSGVPAVYVDGIFINSYSGTGATTPDSVISYIGRGINNRYFNGSIDDVRVYNRALSAAEVQQLYKQGDGIIVNKTPNIPGSSLQNGLIAWWTFDEQDMETTGTSTDKSGNNNKLFKVLNPINSIGIIGQGTKLGVAGTYWRSTTRVSDNTTTTISVWLLEQKCATSLSMIFSSYVGANNHGWAIYDNCTGKDFGIIYGHPTQVQREFTNFTTPTPNNWQHLVVTYASPTIYIYLNSKFATSSNVGFYASELTYNLVGAYTTVSAFPYQGTLDDMRIWNRVLTPQEIYYLYKQGR